MRCLISPSPALSASTTVRPPISKLPTTMWRVSQPAPIFRQLKLRRRPGESETVALGPRCLVVRALKHYDARTKDGLPAKPNHFVEEVDTIMRRTWKIFGTGVVDGWLLDDEGIDTAGRVCSLAREGVIMASHLVDSGSLTATGLSRKICKDTVQKTLRAYVDVFFNISEECYDRTLDGSTLNRFFDTLRGLASISHILIEDALESLNHTHPRKSLLEYEFNSDVKNIYRDFNCQMDDLKDDFWYTMVTEPAVGELFQTIYEGVEVTESFLVLMGARRQRILGKAHGDSK